MTNCSYRTDGSKDKKLRRRWGGGGRCRARAEWQSGGPPIVAASLPTTIPRHFRIIIIVDISILLTAFIITMRPSEDIKPYHDSTAGMTIDSCSSFSGSSCSSNSGCWIGSSATKCVYNSGITASSSWMELVTDSVDLDGANDLRQLHDKTVEKVMTLFFRCRLASL